MIALFQLLLLLLSMLWLVPMLTGGNVRVHGGFIKAGLILLGVGILDVVLWVGLTAVTLFTDVILNILTFGLVALLVRAFAYLMVGRLAPRSLYVRDYWSALGAAFIMAIASWAIMHYVR